MHDTTSPGFVKSLIAPVLTVAGLSFMVTGLVVSSLMLAGKSYETKLLDTLAAADQAFAIENASSAKIMVDTIVHPVSRAVFVPATQVGPKTGVVCAVTQTGELELYGFGQMSLTHVDVSATYADTVSAFCGTAFAEISGL